MDTHYTSSEYFQERYKYLQRKGVEVDNEWYKKVDFFSQIAEKLEKFTCAAENLCARILNVTEPHDYCRDVETILKTLCLTMQDTPKTNQKEVGDKINQCLDKIDEAISAEKEKLHFLSHLWKTF